MNSVTLYSTGCPKCKVLESKLNSKNIRYNTVSDMNEIMSLGFKTVPLLKVDGNVMKFKEAVDWVNEI